MEQQVAKKQPFYLQVSHYAIHIWHDSLQETREMFMVLPHGSTYQKKADTPEDSVSISMYNHGWIINYAALLDDMDRATSTLLDAIDELGIVKNTFVSYHVCQRWWFLMAMHLYEVEKEASTKVGPVCPAWFVGRGSAREPIAMYESCSGICFKRIHDFGRWDTDYYPRNWTGGAFAMFSCETIKELSRVTPRH